MKFNIIKDLKIDFEKNQSRIEVRKITQKQMKSTQK